VTSDEPAAVAGHESEGRHSRRQHRTTAPESRHRVPPEMLRGAFLLLVTCHSSLVTVLLQYAP